jgi:hypothetical protein
MRSMVAAAGGAPAGEDPRRRDAGSCVPVPGPLEIGNQHCGCRAKQRNSFVIDEPVDRRCIYLPQADVGGGDGSDEPGECPAVGVNIGSVQRYRSLGLIGMCASVPIAFTQALRCVIMTPFGFDVVPLV